MLSYKQATVWDSTSHQQRIYPVPPQPREHIDHAYKKRTSFKVESPYSSLFIRTIYKKNYKHSNSNYFISIHVLSCDE